MSIRFINLDPPTQERPTYILTKAPNKSKIASAKKGSDKTVPPLPVELWTEIIKIAHYANGAPLAPVMRVNWMFNAIAEPLLYDTIHLNQFTLVKLPACILVKSSDKSHLRESSERKIDALARTTKLVIEEIPILFHKKYDRDLVEFCQKVVFPNVTKVVWRQDRAGEWDKKEIRESKEEISTLPNYAVQRCRADMFKIVLPAANKTMCIQVPKSGLFQNLGPAATARNIEPWDIEKRYNVRTIDRIMEYLNAMTGQVEIRIHQSINNRYISLGSLPTIYHFHRNRTEYSAQSQILAAYRLACSHHLLPLVIQEEQGIRDYLLEFCVLLRRSMSLDQLKEEGMKVVEAWPLVLSPMTGVKEEEVSKVLFHDFLQVAAALRAEGTKNACPCCGQTGVALG